MLDRLINFVSHLGAWGYAIIFLGVFLESAAFVGFVIPGETLVLLGGFLAAQGSLRLGHLIIWVCLGAILGDSVGYLTGKHIGRERILRIGRRMRFGHRHLARVEGFFRRHGGKAVFLSRFVAMLRAMTPFVAGSSGMRWWRFFFYNAAGGIVWGVGFVLIGYFLGAGWRYAGRWIGEAAGGVVAIIALFFVLGWIWRWLNRHEMNVRHWWGSLMRRPRMTALRRRFEPRLLELEKRLNPWVTLGLYLLLGLVILIVAVGVFVEIARFVLAGVPVDQWVEDWLHQRTAQPLISFFFAMSALASGPVIAGFTAAIAAALLLWRRWSWLLELILVVPGGMVLNEGLKIIFRRPRPHFLTPLVHPGGYSFPSEHTVAATLLYGLAAIFIMQLIDSWKWRTFTLLAALALVILIAFSRVYLGAHYPTDVLAAIAEGVAWLAICLTGVRTQQRLGRLLA